ncbi:hypothetical protein HU200_052419 [Digitaria exilis]|uniref:Uncharacterized protein n=1 Tax=Digitaria exilis TaxID=1010633 RepID=A0A835E5Y0_9POAL|nr:hypothetical protein HU200_052419 [Digitaria exilis]
MGHATTAVVSVRKNKEESSRRSSPPPAFPSRHPAIALLAAVRSPGSAEVLLEETVAAAVVEDVMRLHEGCGGGGGVGVGEMVGSWRNIDIAWRKAEEAGELAALIS